MADLRKTTSPKDAALSFYRDGKYATAARAFKKYLAANREDYEARFYFGLSLFESRRYNESLEQWKHLKHVGPKQRNIHLNMACTYQNLGRDDLAIRNFKIELLINPICGEALYSLGMLYFDRHMYARACEHLQRCYSMNHSREQIVDRLAHCYFKTRQIEKEIGLYEEWLKMHPQDIWCLNNLGAALMQFGECSRAQLYLDKALRIKPTDKMVRRNIAKAQWLRKRLRGERTRFWRPHNGAIKSGRPGFVR